MPDAAGITCLFSTPYRSKVTSAAAAGSTISSPLCISMNNSAVLSPRVRVLLRSWTRSG
ncbi:MAG TPA: hypothetical protein VIM27_10205 [Gaiellales bacterium]